MRIYLIAFCIYLAFAVGALVLLAHAMAGRP
jgi:preprotein translocase subunit Sec61beta